MTPEQASVFLSEHQIKFVLAQFVDIHGVAKTKSVPASHFQDILEGGAGFAGFAVWGLGQEPHDPDYMAVGDLSTLKVPESLQALVAARLDALDHADRALLQDASVLGQTFATAALVAVSGVPLDVLEGRLRDLARREVLMLDTDPREPRSPDASPRRRALLRRDRRRRAGGCPRDALPRRARGQPPRS